VSTDTQTELTYVREKLVEKEQEVMALRQAFARIQTVVNAQAEDPKVWVIKDAVLLRPEPSQQALRALHAAIENESQTILGVGYANLSPSSPMEDGQLDKKFSGDY